MRSVAAPRRRDLANVSKGMACIRLLCLLIPLLAADGLAGTPPPEGDPVPTGWLGRVQQGIAEQEYQASRNRLGLQAPNRAHDLRTYFDAAGIRVHDRSAAESPELLGLSLVGLGRGGELSPLAPGELVSEGARVEIRRPGLVLLSLLLSVAGTACIGALRS